MVCQTWSTRFPNLFSKLVCYKCVKSNSLRLSITSGWTLIIDCANRNRCDYTVWPHFTRLWSFLSTCLFTRNLIINLHTLKMQKCSQKHTLNKLFAYSEMWAGFYTLSGSDIPLTWVHPLLFTYMYKNISATCTHLLRPQKPTLECLNLTNVLEEHSYQSSRMLHMIDSCPSLTNNILYETTCMLNIKQQEGKETNISWNDEIKEYFNFKKTIRIMIPLRFELTMTKVHVHVFKVREWASSQKAYNYVLAATITILLDFN